MIIDPDFLDHWKTRTLVGALGGDELAPLYLLRLWAHCQVRKTHRFQRLSSEALAAICRFKGDAGQLWLAIQTSGFGRVKDEVFIVHDWDKHNKSLISSWRNGRFGGRKRKPTGIPTGNPPQTHGGVEKRREEKRREDSLFPADEPQVMLPAKPRNLVMDELARVGGIPLNEIGAAVAKRLQKVISAIKESTPDVTPGEVAQRALNYRSHFPDTRCTPEALAKHWGTCHAAGKSTSSSGRSAFA
jgi:hypothetical protein